MSYDEMTMNQYLVSRKQLDMGCRKLLIQAIDCLSPNSEKMFLLDGEPTNDTSPITLMLVSNNDKEDGEHLVFLQDVPASGGQPEQVSKIDIRSPERLINVLKMSGQLISDSMITGVAESHGGYNISTVHHKRNERGAGRKPISDEIKQAVLDALEGGSSIRNTAEQVGVSTATVQKIKKERLSELDGMK